MDSCQGFDIYYMNELLEYVRYKDTNYMLTEKYSYYIALLTIIRNNDNANIEEDINIDIHRRTFVE